MDGNFVLIFIYLLFLVSTICVGSIISRVFRLEFESVSERYFFRFVFGCVFFSYLFLLLGALHLLYSQILLAFYLIPLIYPFLFLFGRKRINFSKENIFPLLLLIFILLPIVPYLFLYPYSWDTLAYHLALPKLYLEEHAFYFHLYFSEIGYPIGIESLYGFGEIFKDPRFADLLNFTFIAATASYMMFGLKKIFTQNVAYLAVIIYALSPTIYSDFGLNPFIDYAFSFFGLAVVIALYRFLESKKFKWMCILVVLGLFLPLIKLTGFFLVFALAFIVIIFVVSEKPKIFLKKIILITALAALPITFWLTKNTLQTHNPFYPFMSDVFNAVGFDSKIHHPVMEEYAKYTANAIKGLTAFSRSADNAESYSAFGDLLSYFVMITSSIASFFMVKGRMRYLSFYVFFTLATIGLISTPTIYRFLLPIMPVAALVSANWFIFAITNWKWRYLPFVGVFILFLFVQVDSAFTKRREIFTNVPKKTLFSYFSSKNAKIQFYQNADNALMVDYINQNLDSKKDKALLVFDNRFYYFQIPVVFENPGTTFNYFQNSSLNNFDDVVKALKKDGINYILINYNGFYYGYTNLNRDAFQSFIKSKLTNVQTLNNVGLYKVND